MVADRRWWIDLRAAHWPALARATGAARQVAMRGVASGADGCATKPSGGDAMTAAPGVATGVPGA